MTTKTTQVADQQATIVTNMYRYAYWVYLDKEIAIQVVSSTLHQLADEALLKAEFSQDSKIFLLKQLQSECEKSFDSQIPSRKFSLIGAKNKISGSIGNGKENSVQTLRSKLRKIKVVDRAIFVLAYLWDLRLVEVAEILQLSQERAEFGFNETLKDLRDVVASN